MTESTTIKSARSDRKLEVEAGCSGLTRIEILGSGVHLTPADAHRLAEWIIENIPKPPTGREKFDALPLGGLFRVAEGERTCVKVGEVRYVADGGWHVHSVEDFIDPEWGTFEEVEQ